MVNNKDFKEAYNSTNEEIGVKDPYLDMELGLRRGDEEGLPHALWDWKDVGEEVIPMVVSINNLLLDLRKYEFEYIDRRT